MSSALKKQLIAVVTAATLICSPLFVVSTIAVEVSPIEKIDPEKLQNDLNGIGSGNELSGGNTSNKATLSNKAKPSIWCWLTNQSRKPASFHFIDIIEILD